MIDFIKRPLLLSTIAYTAVHSQGCSDPGSDANSLRLKITDDIYLYTCNEGYATSSGADSLQLECTNGLWGPQMPPIAGPGNEICKEQDSSTLRTTTQEEEETTTVSACTDPGQVENAFRDKTGGFEHGESVFYTCNAGFCAVDARTRLTHLQCFNGEWSVEKPVCERCDACEKPADDFLEDHKIHMTVHEDYTATIECYEGYVKTAGTNMVDGTLDCIENQVWSPEVPVCSKKPQVVCGSDFISIVINKNMLDSLGFTGGADSLAMTGYGESDTYVESKCFPTLDDAGENYMFNLDTPFSDSCRTAFNMIDHNYKFSNRIVWKQMKEHSAVMRSATLLEFDCSYMGLFTTSLENPIKIAISTRTYYTQGSLRNGGGIPFTVSMAIYHSSDFTGLIDNAPVIHAGKRYFTELILHEQDMGTPYLKHCYGTTNPLSNEELMSHGYSAEQHTRSFVVNGCPAPRTLVRLEVPPGDEARRFSFMFPKLQLQLAKMPFIYVHCEIQLKVPGYKPSCFAQNKLNDGANNGQGRYTKSGGLAGRQLYMREYGTQMNNGNKQMNIANSNKMMNDFIQNRRGGPSESDRQSQLNRKDFQRFTGRKRRDIGSDGMDSSDWPVSFGPMVMVFEEEEKPEDIQEIEISLGSPVKLEDNGDVVAADEETGTTTLKFNTTFKSEEDDLKRYQDFFNKPRSESLIASKAALEDKAHLDLMMGPGGNDDDDEEIMIREIEEEVQKEEEEMVRSYGSRAIIIVIVMLVGGIAVFIIAVLVAWKTDICQLGAPSETTFEPKKQQKKKQAEKVSSLVPNQVLAGPDMKNYNKLDNARVASDVAKNTESCGTSLTSNDQ